MLKMDEWNIIHLKDGGRQAAIAPGDWEVAQRVLTEEELAQVKAWWTPEIVEKWVVDHPPTPETPPPPHGGGTVGEDRAIPPRGHTHPGDHPLPTVSQD